MSGRFAAQRSSLFCDTRSPLRGLTLPLKRFLECPLTAPLPLTLFTARSAPLLHILRRKVFRPSFRPLQSLQPLSQLRLLWAIKMALVIHSKSEKCVQYF